MYSALGSEEDRYAMGRRIAGIRKVRGLTQVQLGKALGLTRIAVAETEGGKRHVEAIDLIHWAKALDVDIEAILGKQAWHSMHVCALCGFVWNHADDKTKAKPLRKRS